MPLQQQSAPKIAYWPRVLMLILFPMKSHGVTVLSSPCCIIWLQQGRDEHQGIMELKCSFSNKVPFESQWPHTAVTHVHNNFHDSTLWFYTLLLYSILLYSILLYDSRKRCVASFIHFLHEGKTTVSLNATSSLFVQFWITYWNYEPNNINRLDNAIIIIS